MFRMAACWHEILMSVSWFCIEVCVNSRFVYEYRGVEERHFLFGPFCCEFDRFMEAVYFPKEGV